MSTLQLLNKKSQQWLKQRNRINQFDITVFLRQFATLIGAGIPIIQCCEILEKSQEKTALRLLIYAIKRELLSGKNLCNCLKHHSHHFNTLTCQLVQIGEHTGQLDIMLTTLANYQEKHLAFRKRIIQALFYPCIITVTAFMVTFCMLIFVVPKFAALLNNMQGDLPRITLWIFYFSSLLQHHSWIFLTTLSIFVLICFNINLPVGQLLTKLPFIKTCLHKIILARFARNLSITYAAGISLTEALQLTATDSNHFEFNKAIAQLRSKISTGLQLHCAMQTLPIFPILMVQMIKIGEESSRLEQMLDKIADFLESDVEQFIRLMSELLEPLIMIVLGVLIGGLIIGIYLPIFKLGSSL